VSAELDAIPWESAPLPSDDDAPEQEKPPLSLTDFYAYMPDHRYIFTPSREMWPSSSVNARVPPVKVGVDDKGKDKYIPASAWIDQHRPVEQMTWAPGAPLISRDRLVSNGGWVDHPGSSVFNQYRGPQVEAGDHGEASRWVEHIQRVYPDDAAHIIAWLAHRVQRPGEKINHALVLGGNQGVGKDTLLEPVKYAVGAWNFCEVSPAHLLGRFNGFVKSVILRISEARDLGDMDRFAFYDHMKIYTAAPPDVLRCDEKNIREHSVFNVMGVIVTSNHKADGIYLPADDRRHYVAWSDLERDSFDIAYWNDLYQWYQAGGIQNVASFLAQHDLSDFDPKAPPPKTPAFWDIVDANRAPEDDPLADALDTLGTPAVVTIPIILTRVTDDAFSAWLGDRKNSRLIPHRLESAGYTSLRNPNSSDGRWTIGSKRIVVYGRKEVALAARIEAAKLLTGQRF
jgi:Family of unknown function (DUF5906)